MTEFRFIAVSENATDQLGHLLADTLPDGTVIALIGTLGAGKTRLVQGVASAVGIPADNVTSPTFVLVNEYTEGRRPIYHFDTYRLHDEDEFLELGPEEYFDRNGLTFVEWADRVERCLPLDYLKVQIEVLSENKREFIITASSTAAEELVEQLIAKAAATG